jgi:hypothetical protein
LLASSRPDQAGQPDQVPGLPADLTGEHQVQVINVQACASSKFWCLL